jgi:hypothetical protein
MKPYIIVPIEWIEKEIAMYGERIIEYGDKDYYVAKIMLLYKMMEEFKIINEYYGTARERTKSKRNGKKDIR